MTSIQDGLKRYLTACRHDIAHIEGSSEQAIAAWVAAHQAEAEALYNQTLQAGITEGGDEVQVAEAAMLAVKQWAQGEHYHHPQPEPEPE